MLVHYTVCLQVGGYKADAVPGSAQLLAAEIELGMALFGLEKRHLFYDRDLETKIVVAWNASEIVIAARGSATKSNFLEDAKVRRLAAMHCSQVDACDFQLHYPLCRQTHLSFTALTPLSYACLQLPTCRLNVEQRSAALSRTQQSIHCYMTILLAFAVHSDRTPTAPQA